MLFVYTHQMHLTIICVAHDFWDEGVLFHTRNNIIFILNQKKIVLPKEKQIIHSSRCTSHFMRTIIKKLVMAYYILELSVTQW